MRDHLVLATLQVLMFAGPEGLSVRDLIHQAAALQVAGWDWTRSRQTNVSGIIGGEPNFVHVGSSKYAHKAFPGGVPPFALVAFLVHACTCIALPLMAHDWQSHAATDWHHLNCVCLVMPDSICLSRCHEAFALGPRCWRFHVILQKHIKPPSLSPSVGDQASCACHHRALSHAYACKRCLDCHVLVLRAAWNCSISEDAHGCRSRGKAKAERTTRGHKDCLCISPECCPGQ